MGKVFQFTCVTFFYDIVVVDVQLAYQTLSSSALCSVTLALYLPCNIRDNLTLTLLYLDLSVLTGITNHFFCLNHR